MRTHHASFAAVALIGGLLTAAAAHAASPQIPTPANPFPDNPVATDGTSLLPHRTTGPVAVFEGHHRRPVIGLFAIEPRF